MVMPITQDYIDRLLNGSSLLDTHQTATALNVSDRTIIRWRSEKINLDYIWVGKQIRYEPEVIKTYKQAQTIRVSSFPSDSHQRENVTSPAKNRTPDTESAGHKSQHMASKE
jgi:hypothetical protein